MAFHTDFHYSIKDGSVTFTKSISNQASALASHDVLSLHFRAVPGTISISVAAKDMRDPERIRVVAKQPVEEFNLTSFTVELFAPGQSQAVASWTQPKTGWSPTETFTFAFVLSMPAPGGWECHVKNTAGVATEINVAVNYAFDRNPLRQTSIPFSLLENPFSVVIEALTPTAEIAGHEAVVGFGEELRQFFDPPPAALGPHRIVLPANLQGTGRLLTFQIEACSGKQALDAMRVRHQTLSDTYEAAKLKAQQLGGTLGAATVQAINHSIAVNDTWKQGWETVVRPDCLSAHIHLSFSDIHLDREVDLIIGSIDVDVADVLAACVDLYPIFPPDLGSCSALVITKGELSGTVAELAQALGLVPGLNDLVDSMLRPLIEGAGPQIGRFLGEALALLCQRDSVFLSATANDFEWKISFADLPLEGLDHLIGGGGTSTGGGHIVTGQGDQATKTVSTPASVTADLATRIGDLEAPAVRQPVVTAAGPATGALPAEFVAASLPERTFPETLARLDKITTIVVVMMENRSFDHMLGYLRQSRGPAYEGLTGHESNSVAGRPQPVKMRPAQKVVAAPATRILHGPEHGFDHVKKQIALGAMSGFAQDYENQFPGEADRVMTYYTAAELPVYDFLASHYAVCDHWFAAHAGPTWPNRWVTMSGRTSYLDNPDNNTPDLGYLEGPTIFEVLASHGIEWRLFESDLSLVRTYNHHRLDNQRIVPYINKRDVTKSFAAMAQSGTLPPVVFVEPNFSDIPPLKASNDDLVPVDLRKGQNFINDVYKAVRNSPQWNTTLLVITYDEHGGFYDHVPPPGVPAPLGLPEWVGKIPRIHPDGRDHLGVRVPAFLVSPMVNAGSVCKDVFDHTSILKTILLRHRTHFAASELTQFGARVNAANHLGLALNLDDPRIEPSVPLARLAKPPAERDSALPAPKNKSALSESLRHAFLPRPGTRRTG